MTVRSCGLAALLLASIATTVGATTIPGVFQAEDYDIGGEGVAYHDTTPGNTGGVYRADDVDIEAHAGGQHIAYIDPGEWLRYTVTATTSFAARVRCRVASATASAPYAWRVSLDDRTIDVENGYATGGWFNFINQTSSLPFQVSAGVHTVRVDFIIGDFNLDELEFMVESNAAPPYLDPVQPVTNRVADLMSRMTVTEKKAQLCLAGMEFFGTWGDNDQRDIATLGLGAVLNGAGASIPDNTAKAWADRTDRYQGYAVSTRLHIPIIYGVDAVHGHGNVYGAVVFPHNIGLGATRDPAIVERAGQVTAVELRATGMHWTYAPAVSVPRDVRWGRYYEGFGETPDLSGEMGAAAVRGLQGSDMASGTNVLACAKHFAGDGGTAWGSGVGGQLDQGNTILDEATFRALHVAPYSNAIAAGVMSVMASYSSWNGVKMHSQTNMLTGLLKDEWGFKGLVVSDWKGVDQIVPSNYPLSIVISINAGVDMVMVPDQYKIFLTHMDYAVAHTNITMARLDDAVRRILTVKFMLGLFDRPFADRSLLPTVGSAEHRSVARQAVRESMVVLKNAADLLPLPKDLTRVHVAGKSADNLGYQCGGWTISWQGGSGAATIGTTIYQAITQTVSAATQVTFSQDGTGAAGAAVGIVVVGETPYAESIGDSATINLSTQDVAAINNVKAAGVPTVVILVAGRPLDVSAQLTNCDALVMSWLPGTEGQGVADVVFGDYFPQARLPHTWPRSIAQVPLNVGDTNYDPLFAFDEAQSIEPAVHIVPGVASWPDGSTGFILQAATSLVAGVTWTNLPGSPVRTDGLYRVATPPGSDALYYRLIRP